MVLMPEKPTYTLLDAPTSDGPYVCDNHHRSPAFMSHRESESHSTRDGNEQHWSMIRCIWLDAGEFMKDVAPAKRGRPHQFSTATSGVLHAFTPHISRFYARKNMIQLVRDRAYKFRQDRACEVARRGGYPRMARIPSSLSAAHSSWHCIPHLARLS
ncbi:hypothetical protein B0H16DRAFT_323408 [Mycena metata]|uniref:Uncharacterized protein n=1 Tax=Mycena metata TaxID=1033252 RepID=A0AAD7HPJ7_9AGAR|nr:hypothetical protein B0H16DRAFT_323408 [Mycena metata]